MVSSTISNIPRTVIDYKGYGIYVIPKHHVVWVDYVSHDVKIYKNGVPVHHILDQYDVGKSIEDAKQVIDYWEGNCSLQAAIEAIITK